MFEGKKVFHVVAVGALGEIGVDNQLLWHIPQDLAFFKATTIGSVVLMGKKTVESLPRPLKNRAVLGVSNTLVGKVVNGVRHMSLDVALKCGRWLSDSLNSDNIYIAGGAELYDSTHDVVDGIFLTRVHKAYPNADTHYKFPKGFIRLGFSAKPVKHGEVNVTFEYWGKPCD